ncbi:MAG: DbpA RNA binding domain-containing protein, partial [Balneolales bacterium]
TEMLNNKRIGQFTQRITDTLAKEQSGFFYQLIEEYQQEHNVPALEIAAALASLVQGNTPLLLNEPKSQPAREKKRQQHPTDSHHQRRDKGKSFTDKPETRRKSTSGYDKPADISRPGTNVSRPKRGMERFRLEVGTRHGITPGNIVGAITAEAGLTSKNIDQISIHEQYSTVDLPEGMPKDVFKDLKNVKLSGQRLNISKFNTTGHAAKPVRNRNVTDKPARKSRNQKKPK